MAQNNPRSGSKLADMFRAEGSYEEVKTAAIKSVLAYKLAKAMQEQNISKAQMARDMETSRSQLDRLLDPENDSVTIGTLQKAASVLGMRLELDLRSA